MRVYLEIVYEHDYYSLVGLRPYMLVLSGSGRMRIVLYCGGLLLKHTHTHARAHTRALARTHADVDSTRAVGGALQL